MSRPPLQPPDVEPTATPETGGPEPTREVPEGRSRRVVDVSVDGRADGVVVTILGDASQLEYESFELKDPPRFVIDLPGVTYSTRAPSIETGYRPVPKVRIGKYEDKTRFVVDLDTERPIEVRSGPGVVEILVEVE